MAATVLAGLAPTAVASQTPEATAPRPTDPTAVRPIDWDRLRAAPAADDAASARLVAVLANSNRFALTTWWAESGYAGQTGPYLDLGALAGPAYESFALAVSLRTDAYDPTAVGVPNSGSLLVTFDSAGPDTVEPHPATTSNTNEHNHAPSHEARHRGRIGSALIRVGESGRRPHRGPGVRPASRALA